MAGVAGASKLRTLLLGTPASNSTVTGVASGTSQWIEVSEYPYLSAYVTASAALSDGTLLFEEADFDPSKNLPFSGTASTFSTTVLATPFAGAGGQYAIHFPVSAYAFVRARLSVTAVGGTVSVVLRGC